MGSSEFNKRESSDLDVKLDWAPWLDDLETIESFSFSVSSDSLLVKRSFLVDENKSVVVILEDGTAEVTYAVVCSITTTDARVDNRTFLVNVV